VKIPNGLLFVMLLALSDATCKSSLFKMYSDRYLPNHVIKTVLVTSQFECPMTCSRHDACESWNLYETAQSGLTCELNSATTVLENSLQRRDGAIFGRRLDIDSDKVSVGQCRSWSSRENNLSRIVLSVMNYSS
jgi:hypothetical protein